METTTRGPLAPATADIRLAPKVGVRLPREANPWWWHPGQAGVRSGPSDFEAKLASVDPDLAITWDAYQERWTLWLKNPKNRYGWTLLFTLKDSQGRYIPPDERSIARLYAASARKFGNAKQYFDAVEREYWREKEARAKADKQNVIDRAMPQFEYAQIKNIGKGSKFSDFHA